MVRKATKIQFNMAETSLELENNLVQIDNNCYTRRTYIVNNSVRFTIPKQIIDKLNLKAGDVCFFVQYSEGFYLSFINKPESATKAQIRSRKLVSQGQANTIHLVIPPFIKNLYKESITAIQLLQIKGFKPYEWQIQFLFTDFT